ncbi:polysaccharide deacetylase [Azorhizobium caulinodans ORS 571]|uniref:Chitooligosaccharide deacetylase n=1 Tax=Azorhizobium caulinodans (strain ATCC 43989 / DSM 5975 / JCM 20966 / LMG 6465 / NBRC 14845 / NCIMB 13405 / ORS 571) TaxID=438753 RepID=A8HQT0_AZOC5|nr:polysaccharide deacetylase family protein [Azorhizobium caulinodans]BAF87058.1 polysaccharide deacetylase [Azorhizobium caulinodans ORS 571]
MPRLSSSLLLALPLCLAAGAAVAAPACYAPSALKAVPGEEKVQPHTSSGNTLAERLLPPVRPVAGALAGSIRRVNLPAGVKMVALTFDLCEASSEVSGYDGALVDYLRDQNVQATFFAGGKWAVSHPERASQIIADPLFEVGNHTWSHANMTVTTGTTMQRQVDDADMAIAARRAGAQAAGCNVADVPERTTLFRFPYGSCSADSMAYVNETGHLAIQWDVDSGDPAFLGAKFMAEAMLKAIKPGSIVLMHANGRGKHTAEALRILIPALKAKGYQFATVSQLIAAGTPVIAATCYSERPGDTKVYDDAARAGRRILPTQ